MLSTSPLSSASVEAPPRHRYGDPARRRPRRRPAGQPPCRRLPQAAPGAAETAAPHRPRRRRRLPRRRAVRQPLHPQLGLLQDGQPVAPTGASRSSASSSAATGSASTASPTAHYSCDAVAMDTGEVWVVRYDALLAACAHCPALLTVLHEAMSREIARDRDSLMSLCTLPADARVAEFLRYWADVARPARPAHRPDHAAHDARRDRQLPRHDARDGEPRAVAAGARQGHLLRREGPARHPASPTSTRCPAFVQRCLAPARDAAVGAVRRASPRVEDAGDGRAPARRASRACAAAPRSAASRCRPRAARPRSPTSAATAQRRASRSCACAASSVPRMPGPSAMSVSSRSKRAPAPSASSACSALGAVVTAQRSDVEEAPHHGAHLGVVLDQQHAQARRERSSVRAPARRASGFASACGMYSVTVVPCAGRAVERDRALATA